VNTDPNSPAAVARDDEHQQARREREWAVDEARETVLDVARRWHEGMTGASFVASADLFDAVDAMVRAEAARDLV